MLSQYLNFSGDFV